MRYFQVNVHTRQTFPSFLLHVIDRLAEPRENGIKAANGHSAQPKVRVSGLELSLSLGFPITDPKRRKLLCYLKRSNGKLGKKKKAS